MDDLKDNLRSKFLTDDFRAQLQKGVATCAKLKAMGVRVLRTDYGLKQPLIEVDPLTAEPLKLIPISILCTTEPGGMRRHSKVIDGCMVMWSVAA